MVCPVNPKRVRPKVNCEDAQPVGSPDDVHDVMQALRSPDPEVRRRAARWLEVSSLGALNAAESCRAPNPEG